MLKLIFTEDLTWVLYQGLTETVKTRVKKHDVGFKKEKKKKKFEWNFQSVLVV